MRTQFVNGLKITTGSGNVFADLGLPDADQLLVKAALMIEIIKAVRRLNLTEDEAMLRMGLPKEQVSIVLQGHYSDLSERELRNALNSLEGLSK